MKFCPAQIAPEFTVMIGLALTIKFVVAEPIQPAAVPVNEYEVFDAGDNVILDAVEALLHV